MIVLGACGADSGTATPLPASPSPTVDELSTLIAMQQIATDVPTATPWPTPTPTLSPTPTSSPTATLTPAPTTVPPSPTLLPTNTPRATQTKTQAVLPTAVAMYDGSQEVLDHYWFARPFPRDPSNRIRDYLSRSYPYGSTGGGQFRTHHGVDIQNLLGTDIQAVSSGWVRYAGDDRTQVFGPQKNFYGNLVVIEHDVLAPDGQLLFSLYGHMSEIDVEVGQHVEQGEKIGEVGATGVALGAHLHLEVRIGDPYDYESTYNPDLWLRPWPDYGTLAGRVTDRDGELVYGITITIQSETGPDRYAYSYTDDLVNSDPYYGENFTYGDLPEGDYKVFVRIRNALRFQGEVTVEAGQTNWIEIQLN